MLDLLQNFTLVSLPSKAEALRPRVKAFLSERLGKAPADKRARSWTGFDAEFSRDLARQGWVGLTLPRDYGGGGGDAFDRFVLVEELLLAGAPVAAHWIADRQSGPLLLRYGSDAQRQSFLPRICRGEIFFCIGMSEPNAGSDLASVRTRAVRDADCWVLNGSKIWTTHAHRSHYMIALVRTSGAPDDRQKGLSQFVIDLALPGIEIRPIIDIAGDAHFSEVFFRDVRLPDDALVGEEGAGWSQVNAELAFERSGPERIYSSVALLDHFVQHVRSAGASSAAKRQIGMLIARLATLRQMSLAVTARLASGESPLVEAAILKDLGTQFEQDVPSVIGEALADDPCLIDEQLVQTLAYVSLISPTYSLRGGAREILRGMIARGLGLR
jgi:alkylation response protein AidB-like acyl-CoA dehydrogenase